MAVAEEERVIVADDRESDLKLLTKWPFRYEIVPFEDLYVDKYQRELTSFVDDIAEHFNPAMVGSLIVSERPRNGRKKGKYAVIDGQTRFRGTELAQERWGFQLDGIPCLIYSDMTIEDEAELFADLQRKRRNIATHERFNSDLVAKRPMAVAIHDILKQHGLKVGKKRDQDIQAVAALEGIWGHPRKGTPKEGGAELLDRVIGILQAAWGNREGVRDIYSAELIRGLARFIRDGTNVDDERMIARLKATDPGQLRLRSGMLREGKGGGGDTAIYMADALLTEYTKRGGKK